MVWIIDIILAALVVLGVVIGYHKGFIYMLLSFLGVFIAFIIAFLVSAPVAEYCYDTFTEQPVRQTVSSAVSDHSGTASENAVDQLFSKGGSLTFFASVIGITPESVKESLPTDAVASTVTDYVMENVVRPAAVFILRAVVMIVLFILLTIILRLLSKPIGKLFRSTAIVGQVDGILGAVLGLLKGALWAGLAVALMYVILASTGGFAGLTKDSVQDAFFVRLILNLLNWQV